MPYADGPERLYFEIQGSGPPLLLVRGLSRSLRFWPAPFVEGLERRFTLVLYDHRGIGRSTLTSGRCTTRDLALDACRVLDAAGVGCAHVFGLSLGGMVAQEMVLTCRERVDRLVLGATYASPRQHGPRYRAFLPLLAGGAIKGARGQGVQSSLLLAKTIPGATIEVLPAAGHDFVAQMPERSAKVLERFFGVHGSRCSAPRTSLAAG